MSAAVGNKRKRRVPSNHNNITLNNLSNDLLCSVADYLPKTSRALLAVSLMKNNEPSTASKAIISSVKDDEPYKSLVNNLFNEFDYEMISNSVEKHVLQEPKSYTNYKAYSRKKAPHVRITLAEFSGQNELGDQISEYYNAGWEILDFIDIPKSLAARLTDDDLAAILKCIDAKNNLKRLNLTHCFSIVGHGLAPLRGSVVLEKLDLGLVRQMEIPQAFNDMQLSEEVVYSILYGILSMEGNTFKRLQVPMNWGIEGENNDPSERLSKLLANASDGRTCAFMNEKNICAYFGFDDSKNLIVQFDNYDSGTDKTDRCFGCSYSEEFNICAHCNKVKCYGCDDDVNTCNGCNIVTCGNCRGDEDVLNNCVRWCDSDWCEARCGDCRFRDCCNGTLDCAQCKAMSFGRLLEQNATKQSMIEQLRLENNEKKVENDQLRQELSLPII